MGLSGGICCGADLALPGAAKSSREGFPLPLPAPLGVARGGADGPGLEDSGGRPAASARNPRKKATTRPASCREKASVSMSWRFLPEYGSDNSSHALKASARLISRQFDTCWSRLV